MSDVSTDTLSKGNLNSLVRRLPCWRRKILVPGQFFYTQLTLVSLVKVFAIFKILLSCGNNYGPILFLP